MSSLLCQLSYKPNAILVGRLGFEPRFAGLKVRCIASYANNPFKYGLGNGYLFYTAMCGWQDLNLPDARF